MQGSGDSAFGKSIQVTEPPIGETKRIGFSELDMDDVGYLNPSRGELDDANDFPRARDWTVYIRPDVLRTDGGGFVGPDVLVRVEYGTGGATQTMETVAPVFGVCVHVAAQYLQVSAIVRNQIILEPRELFIAASIQPGRPARNTLRQTIYPLLNPTFVDIAIPPFAVDFVATGAAGGAAGDATAVVWGWQPPNGGFVPIVSHPASPAGADARLVPSGWTSPPNGANVARVALVSGAPITRLDLQWGVCA